MLERDLSGPGQTRALRNLIQSVFATELLLPSRPLWLFFAWVTDVDILDNSARQFSTLCPDWPAAQIRLSTLFDALLSRRGTINVVLRDERHNQYFIERMRLLRHRHGSLIRWCQRAEFHEKGMLGSGYMLDGSMNLTVRGLTSNDEHVILRCDPAAVAQRRVELLSKWEHLLQ
jgi:PLD-like domain